MEAELDILIELKPSLPNSNALLYAPVDSFLARHGLSRQAFYSAFAHRVASRFLSGDLTFEVSDTAMNNLHGYCLTGPSQDLLPEFAWQVYRAFDAGEFLHPGDGTADDPPHKYTIPRLKKHPCNDSAKTKCAAR